MDAAEVMKLAELARIKISPEEATNLSQEFAAILAYVSEVKGAAGSGEAELPVRNVMRSDSEGHAPGMYTEELLAAAPEREGDYIKVKKIL